MKKFIKGALISAAICFVTGLLLLGIGIATGGLKQIGNGVVAALESIGELVDIEMSDFSFNIEGWDFNYPVYASGEDFGAVSENEVEELQMVVFAGNFEVERSRDNTYYVESDLPFQCYNDNGALYVAGGIDGAIGDVTLYVPEDSLNKVTIAMVAGNFECNTMLESNDVEVYVTGGNVEMTDLKADTLQVSTVAGNVEIGNGIVSQGEIHCLMGNVSLEGAILSALKTDCIMGNVYMEMRDETISYQCRQNNILGSIILGVDLQGEDADAMLDLRTVMGNIEVQGY